MDFPIRLTESQAGPLHVQLYNEYRTAILTGRLAPGQRVPSTRHLATQLTLSRTTVTRTYDDLIAEGYLESSRGSGTFVCRELPDEKTNADKRHGGVPPQAAPVPRLSSYAARLAESIEPATPPLPSRVIDFYSWRPGFDALPMELWARLLARHARTAKVPALDYDPGWLGCESLRVAIASYLGRSRAVQCTPDQILITAGSQQAFTLIVRILINAGEAAAMEEPGYFRIRQVLMTEGARILPVPVDDSGVRVDLLDALPAKPKLIYVTPSHQYPTGAVLPLNRRLELVSWARENEVFIIEDDYDSEYRYAGRPFPSLQGLDQHGTVIYTGTFSKVLFPALRIGYVVAPPALVPALMRAKRMADRQGPTVEHTALAEFVSEGHLERHLRRTRVLYDERRRTLVEALSREFGCNVDIRGENAGIHILAHFNLPYSDDEILERAAAAGVTIASARASYFSTSSKGKFMIGYAGLTPPLIEEGVRRLASALRVSSAEPKARSADV